VKKSPVEVWLPVVAWLFVIFWFSTDVYAGEETSRFIVPLLRFLFPFLAPDQIDFLHWLIRKASHFSEYFVLTVLTYRSIQGSWAEHADVLVRTLVFVISVAMFDELHQRFTAFRGGSPLDVGYDCLGAVSALWLIATYEARRLRTHSVL
jgi:VanZ family protein